MDTQIANKLEYILSGYQVSLEDFNEIIDLMDSYKQSKSNSKESDSLTNVSEIEKKATKSVLLSYYVGIQDRNMSVEDILNSIQSDLDFIDGELTLEKAKSILNDR